MTELEVIRVTVEEWPDGTRIEQNRYRHSTISPWISGLHEVYCGSCKDQVGEEESRTEARLKSLEHQLHHVQEELASYRSAFFRAAQGGPRAT